MADGTTFKNLQIGSPFPTTEDPDGSKKPRKKFKSIPLRFKAEESTLKEFARRFKAKKGNRPTFHRSDPVLQTMLKGPEGEEFFGPQSSLRNLLELIPIKDRARFVKGVIKDKAMADQIIEVVNSDNDATPVASDGAGDLPFQGNFPEDDNAGGPAPF